MRPSASGSASSSSQSSSSLVVGIVRFVVGRPARRRRKIRLSSRPYAWRNASRRRARHWPIRRLRPMRGAQSGDQRGRAGAAGEQQQHGADHEKGETCDEGDGGLAAGTAR